MNINLLQLVGKYIVFTAMSIMSLFNIGNYNEKETLVNNANKEKDYKVVNSVTDYKTVVKYNSKLPKNVSNVTTEGTVGLSYTEKNEQTTETKVVQEVVNEVIEKGTGDYGIYKGKLVGYGPDCVGCSGEGYLACRKEDGSKFSLKYDGIYYNDDQYGSVRILAAATEKFPCGTIVEIKKDGKELFKAVVLDTGGTVKNAWKNGSVIMDLAYEKNALSGSDGLTGSNIIFSVQRWGW